ncbi:MAG: histidine--tRNA ligase [Methanobrevibacter sp.]|jgi:histidyl-tRNA synthetase|nr:histidine--tRNA ligase [Candidatus Methanoflexus mossambicus]
MKFNKPRGTRDFLFEEMKNRKKVENILRDVFENYAYQEIKTPLFEELSLFTTKSGDQIVEQLYNFEDKSGRELALRPELTAPVARLYLNELQKVAKPLKLYYFGSCFRYERPQKGRFRQFWQLGCELIGAKFPEGEAEIIAMAEDCLNRLGLNEAEIHINNLSIIRNLFKSFEIDEDIQEKIMILIDKGNKELLVSSLNDKEQFDINNDLVTILINLLDLIGGDEVLDDIFKLFKNYENLDNVKDSLNDLVQFVDCLKSFNVKNYKINPSVARGLDYYTGIVFEIYIPSLGAQKQVAGGGSYNLVKLFGGESVESTGFAFGFDRLMNAYDEIVNQKNKNDKNSNQNNGNILEEAIVDIYVAPMSDNTRDYSFKIAQTLRKDNKKVELDLAQRKFKKLIKAADKLNSKYIVLIGEDELSKNSVNIKNMSTGEQELVAIGDVSDYFNSKL